MPPQVITSPANPLLKEIRKAQQQGGLTDHGWLIAEGPHLVAEAARSGLRIAYLILTDGLSAPESVPAERVIHVPERVYRAISGAVTPQGIMALAEPPNYSAQSFAQNQRLIVVLDSIQDPGNAGAISRSAEAFGATGLIFFDESANPLNPKTLRSSAGSLFRVPSIRQKGPLALPFDAPVFAGVADPQAPCAWDCNLAQPCTIVVGNEGRGISPGILRIAQKIRIPTSGVESLNAGVAASLLLYEAARQRNRR